MRQERETCKWTKTQNIVTFYVITITKRSWAVIPALKQLSLVLYESTPCFAFLHQRKSSVRKLIPKLVAFHTMTLKIKSIRSQLRPAGHVASERQVFSCMLEISVVLLLFFYFLLLITKIPIE